MKHVLTILLLPAALLVHGQQKKPAAPAPKTAATAVNPLKTKKDSVSYALGLNIARNLQTQGLDNLNLALVQKGMDEAFNKKKAAMTEEACNGVIQNYMQKISADKALANKVTGQKFLQANAKRPGMVSLADGLQYEVLRAGTDTTHPKSTDRVKCHYHGTLIDGTVFDSSVDRGTPADFPVNGVIRGWQEILPMMTVGSKWKVYIPSDLAYGDQGAGGKIGPGSALIFDIELIAILK